MACLTDDTLVAMLLGQLDEGMAARGDEHLAECSVCRAVLAESARGEASRITRPDKTSALIPTRAPPLLPGTLVGRYTLGVPRGEGGTGVVYEAYDPQLHRNIAIKLLRGDSFSGASLEDQHHRLLREARAMAQLSHPNVVPVFDVGTYGDRVFVAMELVDGLTLKHWMKSPRSWSEVVDVFLDAGAGLEAAHVRGLVHRDFKPDNVLMGADGRVRVTDFGLARAIDASQRERSDVQSLLASPLRLYETITRTGFVGGTPAYMAPEQLRGEAPDPRSDQFSFCVAFYEALVGRRPYTAATVARWADGDRDTSIDVTTPTADLPRWLGSALRRGLSVRAADRYPSVTDLLAELRAGRRGGLPKRARTLLIGGMGALAVGTIAAIGVHLTSPTIATPMAHAEQVQLVSGAMRTPEPNNPVPELAAPSTASTPIAPSQAVAKRPHRPGSAGRHPRQTPASVPTPTPARRLGDRLRDPFPGKP